MVGSIKKLAFIISTFFGAGLFPGAPGTVGTLAAFPLVYWTLRWTVGCRVIFWSLLTLLASWAAFVFDRERKTRDSQQIVIDEVIGLGVTTWTVQPGDGVLLWIVAIVLFRFFDIFKFPPVRQIDLWSKGQSGVSWLQGFSTIADDLVAGLQALILVVIFQKLGL